MWMILCAVFVATAAIMIASWDEATPIELHPWLSEPQEAEGRQKRPWRR
jgi:hypothetical protein